MVGTGYPADSRVGVPGSRRGGQVRYFSPFLNCSLLDIIGCLKNLIHLCLNWKIAYVFRKCCRTLPILTACIKSPNFGKRLSTVAGGIEPSYFANGKAGGGGGAQSQMQ